MFICLQLVQDEWVVCIIFQKSAGEMMNINAYLGKLDSLSLPSLLEDPCNTAAANDQETRSSESESGTSEKLHEISYFSKPMEPMTNSTERDLHTFECGSNCNYLDSYVQQSLMYRFMRHYSYMHNLNARIYTNMMPATALFSVSNMMRYKNIRGFNNFHI